MNFIKGNEHCEIDIVLYFPIGPGGLLLIDSKCGRIKQRDVEKFENLIYEFGLECITNKIKVFIVTYPLYQHKNTNANESSPNIEIISLNQLKEKIFDFFNSLL